MQELNLVEVEEVGGGVRAVIIGALGSALWDGVKYLYNNAPTWKEIWEADVGGPGS